MGRVINRSNNLQNVAMASDIAMGAMSLEQLAAKYGLTQSAMVCIVMGQRRPNVLKLADEMVAFSTERSKRLVSSSRAMLVSILIRLAKGEDPAQPSEPVSVRDRILAIKILHEMTNTPTGVQVAVNGDLQMWNFNKFVQEADEERRRIVAEQGYDASLKYLGQDGDCDTTAEADIETGEEGE